MGRWIIKWEILLTKQSPPPDLPSLCNGLNNFVSLMNPHSWEALKCCPLILGLQGRHLNKLQFCLLFFVVIFYGTRSQQRKSKLRLYPGLRNNIGRTRGNSLSCGTGEVALPLLPTHRTSTESSEDIGLMRWNEQLWPLWAKLTWKILNAVVEAE